MEGNKKTQPRAILVFGAPCSGKTTFSEKFSTRFKAPYYDLHDLRHRYDLNRQTVLLLVEQLAKTGVNIIIEGGIETEADRDEIRGVFKNAGYTPSLIWIQTDVATIKNRLKLKFKSSAKAKEEYDNQVAIMEAPGEHEKSIILSGKHTFETQLKHVLQQLA